MLQLLDAAYIDARYAANFAISTPKLDALLFRIAKLPVAAGEIFEKRMSEIRDAKQK